MSVEYAIYRLPETEVKQAAEGVTSRRAVSSDVAFTVYKAEAPAVIEEAPAEGGINIRRDGVAAGQRETFLIDTTHGAHGGLCIRFKAESDSATPPSGMVYVDMLEGCAEDIDTRTSRWQAMFDGCELSFGFGCASGTLYVVVYTFTDASVLSLEVREEPVEKHCDLLLPWAVASQEVFSIELEELLLQWFEQQESTTAYAHALGVKDQYGRTPLHVACIGRAKGALRFMKTLLRCRGIFVDARDDAKKTPLHYAVEVPKDISPRDYARVVDLVVFLVEEAEAGLNYMSADGETPLHVAARSDIAECKLVKTLLRAGAHNEVTSKGETAVQVALRCSSYQVASVLENWHSDLDHAVIAERKSKLRCVAKHIDSTGTKVLEKNIGNLALTEAQLREEFNKYDADESGYIHYSEFKAIEERFSEIYGEAVGAGIIQSTIKKYNLLVDGKMPFEAFALLMLKIPQM